MALTDKLTNIANAIRSKTGKADGLTLEQMPGEIESISAGGGGDDSTLIGIIARSLTDVSNDKITTIGTNAFRDYVALRTIDVPNVTTIKQYAFQGCNNLEAFNFPKLVTLERQTFYNCSSLREATLLNVKQIEMNMFNGCGSLKKVDLLVASSLSASVFMNCKVLDTLILRGSTMCTLGNTNSFNGTPFASGGTGGTVYVPSALISAYQTATNWSTLYAAGTCTFLPIEGSEYE